MSVVSVATGSYKVRSCQIAEFFKFWLLLITILVVLASDVARAETFDFSDWDVLLKKYVNLDTTDEIQLNTVNYGMLQSDPVFFQLLSGLKSFSPSQLQTHEEKLAFWINVYNVFAAKMVIDNYPLESIIDVGSLFKSVWKYKAGVIGGRGYTLHEIEHKILRKMGDPRIHAAIVCASISCPDLSTEVFKPERLNEQLDFQMRGFLANPGKGMRVDSNSKRVFLSSIFDWFKEDFESLGGVRKFIQSYVSPKDEQALNNPGLSFSYMKYNWGVNDSSR